MYNLVYKSIAKTLSTSQINEILVKSRDFNSKHDITGCLIYHEGVFIQYLEGGSKDVLYLFERIKVDDRHYEVKLLSNGNIYSREFDTWSMAFLSEEIPNEAFEYIKLMVSSNDGEDEDMSVIPNPTTKKFWLAVKNLVIRLKHKT
ncbi:BLUF domain-containing protein [Maribacter litoralis]|uniref:Sensors of blue-light using FAD n=1 Tax=Maribacter litoralis TaxID=2059726 RepID=A0A653NZC4_9FLAO|nr:BLUF domain-containing protein [Maribacter litoralis]VXB22375.1 Sensors of blue-light using FAD [Maribacter litoralis]